MRKKTYMGAFLALGLVSGCGLEAALDHDSGGSGPHVDVDVDVDVAAILRSLFPSLSDEEIASFAASLSVEEILALREELEAVREAAEEFSSALFATAEERVEKRAEDLAPENDGFPEGFEATGSLCVYEEAEGRGSLLVSGVFEGKETFSLDATNTTLMVDGAAVDYQLECLNSGTSVDVVFLIDITGSMSNVIASVRNSVVSFVDAIESSGLEGTISVVSFQDSVGVNVGFQEPAPSQDYERSPFFRPVSMADADGVESVRAFVNRLEANRGADAPENLAGAVDFARNSVIGYTTTGAPNVIGDGKADPAGTEGFPTLKSDRQVFVALTDVTFHGDDRTPSNSSLLAPFVPRDAADILRSLHETRTTVHVSDPSWQDASLDPSEPDVDADYFAVHTGGLGEDRVLGYSLVDLELVVVASDSGLLDITLDDILGTSCSLDFEADLSIDSEIVLRVETATGTVDQEVELQFVEN